MILPGLTEVFGYDYMQRALVAGVLISLVSTTLGVFTVLRGLAMISDGLAHISFAGIALGLALNIFPLEMALVAAIVGSVGIQLVRAKGWVRSDVAIGLFFTGGLALGVAIVSRGQGITGRVTGYLFGSLLTVTPQDLRWVLALCLVLAVALLLFYKELVYVAFNEEAAKVSGLPVRWINLGASVLTAVGVVLAARVVGVLLVSALIIVPAAAALQVARSFRAALSSAAIVGLLSVSAGLYASFAFDVSPGPAIALVSLGLFVLCAFARSVGVART